MRPPEVVAVRCGGPLPVRHAFYDTLARAVANARRPAGVVFEATATAPRPWAIVRPADLVDRIEEVRGRSRFDLERAAVPEPLAPPSALREMIGEMEPRPILGSPERDGVPPASPTLPVLLGPESWLAWQTFWVAGPPGVLWTARRLRYAAPSLDAIRRRSPAVGAALAFDWELATGVPSAVRTARWASGRDWDRRSAGRLRPSSWLARRAENVAGSAEARWLTAGDDDGTPAGHAVVFGSSGAGKTTYLAEYAAAAIRRGDRVVAIDLHGDLTPGIVNRLDPPREAGVVAVDADRPPIPGIAAITGGGSDDRAAALLVAAVKRLSADGTDVYWGFRLERIFDTMVRLVQESGGSLLDLYDLLTSAERRDVARLATRRPELASFLEELAPVVRRTPDFLWPAATRLSKVALVPALAELLAPADGGLPVEELIANGRSLLVRLPFARIGPEAAALAATFVLARVFLGCASVAEERSDRGPLVLVLDEAHGFSPRLVAEVLAESRKFGVRAIVATQYPERLASEVRSAAAGASARCVVFRVPAPSAAEAGTWLGLGPAVSQRTLPTLAPGHGVEFDPDRGGLRSIDPVPESPTTASRWVDAVVRTRSEFPPRVRGVAPGGTSDPLIERLLLTVLGAEESGRPLTDAEVVRAAAGAPGVPIDPANLADRWHSIAREHWVEARDGRWHLGPGGERWLGLGAPTFATRESAEHRRLLYRTFRIFARHGARLEIVRQGRFDTTLPDARYRQLSSGPYAPVDLAAMIDRHRLTWAWRFFGGRDVHVEAEVSGALRAERIRHGWAKGRERDAAVLFVVGDAMRARRVRGALDRVGVPRGRAHVWTLSSATAAKK